MALKVGMSIVSMNRPQILRQTISRLTCNPRIQQDRIVLVDNGSTDPETLALLETQEREGWHIVRNPTNLGLSRAVNQGLAHLAPDSDALLHMDDDALPPAEDDWLDRMIDTVVNCPELGLLAPNALNYTEFIAHDRYRELRWGLGFCWLIRGETYALIGGYDPQLLHQNECDLALRVRMAGYTVGAMLGVDVKHNDPGGTRSALSLAREHLGTVQFVDKYCQFFRGRMCSYGTVPVYRMQSWPPDQEWYRRFARENNLDLNPPPPDRRAEDVRPGERVMEIVEVGEYGNLDHARIARRIEIAGTWYFCYVDLRSDYAHWARGTGYLDDRDRAIARWFELTGEKYEMYRWPNLLRPEGA
jgi:GT2 family glycosyltransferase